VNEGVNKASDDPCDQVNFTHWAKLVLLRTALWRLSELFLSTRIHAHALAGLIQGEITTSNTYLDSPTLLRNRNEKGFQTIDMSGDGHHH
jgi:hypothetical protein